MLLHSLRLPILIPLLLLPIGLLWSGCAPKPTRLPSGLEYVDLKKGTGNEARRGLRVGIHYEGAVRGGKRFISSRDRGVPFEFVVGSEEVIRGLSDGVTGMKVGGVRRIIVPPRLGYGDRGTPDGLVPPNATLEYEVELLGTN